MTVPDHETPITFQKWRSIQEVLEFRRAAGPLERRLAFTSPLELVH